MCIDAGLGIQNCVFYSLQLRATSLLFSSLLLLKSNSVCFKPLEFSSFNDYPIFSHFIHFSLLSNFYRNAFDAGLGIQNCIFYSLQLRATSLLFSSLLLLKSNSVCFIPLEFSSFNDHPIFSHFIYFSLLSNFYRNALWISPYPTVLLIFPYFTCDQAALGKVHAKGQGQSSKVNVREVTTQLNRFRTVTPVWIHIW